jgi:hypothetical protein
VKRLHCGDQVSSSVRLEYESSSARIEGLANHLIGIGDGENDHFEVRVVLHELACRIQPIQIGHAHVQDHDVGPQLLGFLNRVATVAGFSANFPTFVLLQEGTQPAPHNFVVVS